MPLRIPANHSTLFATKPSLRALITGVPPATEASKPICTLFCLASLNISSPSTAKRALLAVTTCFPFLMAVLTSSPAKSVPPINSTNISTSGLFATSIKLVVTSISS